LVLQSLARKAMSERPAQVLSALLAAAALYWIASGLYEYGGPWGLAIGAHGPPIRPRQH
jgi:hypothetical protein